MRRIVSIDIQQISEIEMASNNSNRKRNQKSKAGSHQKNNSQGENQNLRMRDQVGQQQQWQQHTINQQKQVTKTQNQQHNKQQQQQQPQHSISTFSKAPTQTANVETTPTQNNNLKPRTVSSECYAKRRCNNKPVQDTINKLSLHAAIFWRRQDLVESLLQNGSTPWEVDQQGNTAFMTACKVGETKLMSTLWDSACSKLNIQHSNREGDTALHVCATTGNEECCRFLISRQARLNVKNKAKDTPLHLAAKNDHVIICNMLISSAMSAAATAANDSLDSMRFILEENDKGQTAICVSILHQHAQITRMLLDMLTPKDQAIYLSHHLEKALNETQPTTYDIAGSAIPGSQEVFLHGLLVSLSVLLICFAERVKEDCTEFNESPETRVDHCLSDTNIVQIIVAIASNRYINRQIVPISCFLLIYMMEGVAEQNGIHNYSDEKMTLKLNSEGDKIPITGRKFLEQFLNCNGPNELLMKMNHNMELNESHDSVITIAIALTVVSLVRSALGRSWLESNRCHLTFLKEILLQNRSILSLLTTTCPLLTISYLETICGEFVKLVEVLEARDREQNLAELLWEEERDRKRRERKKQKQQQKKQNANKEAKNKNSSIQPLQIIEVSSDDELCYPLAGDDLEVGRKPESLVDETMEINHVKTANGLGSNNSMECHVSNIQLRNNPRPVLEDDASSTGSECRFVKSGKENTEFPSTSNELKSDSVKNLKVVTGENQGINIVNVNQEMTPSAKCQGKEGAGSVSTVMRWADVAKLGCGISEKSSCGLGDNSLTHPGLHSDKIDLCNWSAEMKNECFDIEDNRLVVNVAEMECSTFENPPCYDAIDQCPVVDINSEEDSSSCSSSSIESHSHLLSSSLLQNRSLSWTSDSKSYRGVQIVASVAPKNTTADQTTSINCQSSPSSSRKKRRKSKQSQKTDQEKVTIHCWSPLKDKSIVYVSADGVTHEDNSMKTPAVIKPLAIVNDPLMLKLRSENVLNPTWLSADKTFGSHSKDYDKIGDSSISSLKCNSKRKDTVTATTFRPEVPSVLPPLKINKELNPCIVIASSSREDATQPIETDEVSEEEMRSHMMKMTTQKRQPFCSKNSPLTSIKSGGMSMCKTNTANEHTPFSVNSGNVLSSCCQNDVLTCTNLSTLALSSSIAQSLLTTLTMSSQYTPPPPGFQAIKQPVSVQTVRDILNLDKNIQSYTKIHSDTDNHTIVPSCRKKGRVITTVLLDKVKNPPLSLRQQNRIPLLSTLAWNCGQESKVSWSNMLQSEPTTAVAVSLLDKTTTATTTRALFTSPGEHNFMAPFSNLTSDTATLPERSKADQQSIISPLEQTPTMPTTFSTILMNRMQQRNHNRDSINTLGIMDGNQMCERIGQNILSLQDSVTSSILDVSIPSVNSCDNTSQQYHHTNPNQNLFNHHSHQVQQPSDKSDIALQTHSTTRGLINKPVKEWIEGKSSSLDSQLLGKRQPTQNKTDGRCISPPVFFPEHIRDQTGSTSVNGGNFPAFHEVRTSDFLSEMFSDPLFTDNIAINQIRQKIQSNQSNTSSHSDLFLQTSEWCDVDLDYYASLYQMKFRDVLGNLPGQNRSHIRSDRQNTLTGNQGLRYDGLKDGRDWPGTHTIFGSHSIPDKQVDVIQPRRHSLRWHRSLQKILDLLWTTRRQYGNIILPHPIPEYSIGMAGNVLIGIGFLMDGTEIAVLIVDKARVHISPRMVEIMSNPEMDKHCLTRCMSFSESSNIQYIAMDLYEYNLCEYLQVCLTTCNQNTATDLYTGLVWQLLQALGFLHHKLGVPHGYLAPCWVFINADGHLRLAGLGITTPSGDETNKQRNYNDANLHGYEYRSSCWGPTEDLVNERAKPSFFSDIRAAGKLAYFILTKGQHLFGAVAPMDTEMNLMREHLSSEAFDLISPMLTSDPKTQPVVDQCLKHPMFWSSDKKFRLILIVGSDVLTEMRTGIALTGTGAPTMMEILSLIDINMVSPNWIHEVDSTVLKEMKSFRVYKNNLAELTLFVYNCCLHFDKLSNSAKEVLDDPCKYFQSLFPSLFMAIYRSLKSSDRTDRTCYKPFF